MLKNGESYIFFAENGKNGNNNDDQIIIFFHMCDNLRSSLTEIALF